MKPPRWIATGLLVTAAVLHHGQSKCDAGEGEAAPFTIELADAHRGYDGESCWVHARAGVIPPDAPGNAQRAPKYLMTTQKLLLSGSDVFYALNQLESTDGVKWSEPRQVDTFARQTHRGGDAPLPTGADIAPHLLQPGDETTVCDFTPQWHAASGRLLGIGHTVWYRDNRVLRVRPRGIAYAVYDHVQQQWADWECVRLPDEVRFQNAGAGSQQRYDADNGDVLVPFYFKDPEAEQFSVAVCRCRFDGRELRYVEHGNEMTVPVKRGLYEPSIARFGDKFFLTLRNDDHGYVCSGDDGLHFDEPRPWTFDDGSDLGNYNTQQHWVSHPSGLYLVYTRRGADNDHVFRHRAPLFIARVDPDHLQVIRASERVLVPERGARLGNFGVTQVSPHETWITAAEWMQPAGVERHGSDNTIWVAKLKWNEVAGGELP